MERPYSLTDELARMAAEREAEQQRVDGRAAYQRFLEYRHGQVIADDIRGRVARASGTSYEMSARTLRQAAAHQPPGLTGQVAAGELRDAAQVYEAEVERQRPQVDADMGLLALRERLVRAHSAHQGAIDRDYYERHREPER